MTNEEIVEVISKGQHDGAKLYRVADWLYKICMVFNWVFGVLGVILAAAALGTKGAEGAALGVLILTVMVCFFGYVTAVIGSNTLKVLVNILFSNLAILDKDRK